MFAKSKYNLAIFLSFSMQLETYHSYMESAIVTVDCLPSYRDHRGGRKADRNGMIRMCEPVKNRGIRREKPYSSGRA